MLGEGLGDPRPSVGPAEGFVGDPTPRAKAEGPLVEGFLNPRPSGLEGELGCVSLSL